VFSSQAVAGLSCFAKRNPPHGCWLLVETPLSNLEKDGTGSLQVSCMAQPSISLMQHVDLPSRAVALSLCKQDRAGNGQVQ
jgi:hypothetical protein